MFARNGVFPTNCNLDEFAIFDYSLTSTEVTDIYNSGTPTDLMELDTLNAPNIITVTVMVIYFQRLQI